MDLLRRRATWLWQGGFAALVLCVLTGVGAGLGAATFWYGEGLSYLSDDPRTCVNCHIMREQYDGWQHASHHAVATCNDCHVPHDLVGKYAAKAEHGFWHSKGFTLQDFHEPIMIGARSARSLDANCALCHRELVNDILPEHAAPGGGGTDCVHCHRAVGHGPTR